MPFIRVGGGGSGGGGEGYIHTSPKRVPEKGKNKRWAATDTQLKVLREFVKRVLACFKKEKKRKTHASTDAA